MGQNVLDLHYLAC